MLELEGYEQLRPPEQTVRTEHVSKPQPESDPVDIWEMNTPFMCKSGVSDDQPRLKHRFVAFSGGDDSLALAHYAMENDLADIVLHFATGSSIPENIDYVRSICEEHQWPLMIIKSPMPFDLFAYRYGFVGPDRHRMAYNYLKGRQLGALERHRPGDIKVISGVRKAESSERKLNIDAEVEYATPDGNFRGWWISPLIDKSDNWVHEYREKHGLRRNPVATKINRSGDCQCMAYGARFSELTNIAAEYPDMAEWLQNVERRTQEYRGRVKLFEDRFPDIYETVDNLRDKSRPKPMRLTVLQEYDPETFEEIVAIPTKRAIQRGRMMPTSYIGHGGVSSDDMKELTAETDCGQKTLCQNCGDGCPNLHSVVEEKTQQAKRTLGINRSQDEFTQADLIDDLEEPEDSHQIIEDADTETEQTEETTLMAF